MFVFLCSNYIPEVRIMSIPNLRYMKVSTILTNAPYLISHVLSCLYGDGRVYGMEAVRRGQDKGSLK
jgi:hypothetical protein